MRPSLRHDPFRLRESLARRFVLLLASLRFMGMGEPEEVRARVYDGTAPTYVQWRDLQGVAHLWPSDGTAGLCGATTAIGEPVELEPGSDFGASSADCLACAKAVVR